MSDTKEEWVTTKKSNSKLARDTAELHLLVKDLEYAHERFSLMSKMKAEESYISTSLFRDGIITLMSCFDTDVVANLDNKKFTKPLTS